MTYVSSLLDPRIAATLNHSGLAVIPTDTVYGLVARTEDERAIAKLYSLKPRERQPGTIIAANIEQLHELGFRYPRPAYRRSVLARCAQRRPRCK